METRTRHGEDIIRIRSPLPFPLRWVNSYLVKGSSGFALIDPGLHTKEAVAAWEGHLRELGIACRDISDIVLTHYHPDHYGLAGWFQQRSGAPVRLSAEGLRQAEGLWSEDRPMARATLRLFLDNGMDPGRAAEMEAHMDSFLPQVTPKPEVTVLPTDGDVRIGDRRWRIIHTPGHALGHLMFHDEERQELICGDHVLPRITPNVSLLPGADPDPLASFLASLAGVRDLPVRLAYPGHRDPFEGFACRVDEIIRHHEERLARILDWLRQELLDAAEVCNRLFGDRLSTHQYRFALSETLAHLVCLERSGRARLEERDGVARYAAF